MKTAEGLLQKLGVINFTKRHLQIINKFIANEKIDCKKLLDELGEWDANDLAICESWANEC
ncbi:MAG: hypothetical protein HRT42_13750 [Campylobacteraceae bacterium]|nr:hypothetical protein [Campylobacteraceae bacterium]